MALSDIYRPVGEYADRAILCVVLDQTVTESLWGFGIFSAFASMTLPDDQGTWAQSHIITLSTQCTQVGLGGPIELTPVEQRRLLVIWSLLVALVAWSQINSPGSSSTKTSICMCLM